MNLKLEEIRTYQLAMEMAEGIWSIVIKWDYFAKDTVGKQLVKAADSIAANLSEGYGRFHYKENKQFCYYGRGSLYEIKTWLTKAHNRKLITDEGIVSFQKNFNAVRHTSQAKILESARAPKGRHLKAKGNALDQKSIKIFEAPTGRHGFIFILIISCMRGMRHAPKPR